MADDWGTDEIPVDARVVCRECRCPMVLSREAFERVQVVNAMQKRKGYSEIETGTIAICEGCEQAEKIAAGREYVTDVALAAERRKAGL